MKVLQNTARETVPQLATLEIALVIAISLALTDAMMVLRGPTAANDAMPLLDAGQNEPFLQQGQRKRRSSKRSHEHSKQNISKQTPRKREPRCICNAIVEPHETRRLRSETTRRAWEATIRAQGQRKQHIASHQNHTFCAFPAVMELWTLPRRHRDDAATTSA